MTRATKDITRKKAGKIRGDKEPESLNGSGSFDLTAIRYDKKKAMEGVEFPMLDEFNNETAATLLIARMNNPNYKAFIRQSFVLWLKRNRKEISGTKDIRDLIPDDELSKIELKALAKTILLGWEGLTDRGNPVIYSTEKAEELLDKYAVLEDQVRLRSMEIAKYDVDFEETLGKN